MQSTKSYRGMRVMDAKKDTRKMGKIACAVFHPEEARLVGFIVKRPDALLMIARAERFLAADRFTIRDKAIHPSQESGTWDEDACRRLGINFDSCLLWEDMPICTEDGQELGFVDSVSFNGKTGEVVSVMASEGGATKALLGSLEIPIDVISGYRGGAIVVDREAARIALQGGLAAKAGEASAIAGAKASRAAAKAGRTAKAAVEESAVTWGTMISDTKAAYEKARGPKTASTKQPSGAKKSAAVKKAQPAPKATSSDELARKFGRQLGKAGGMLSAFKDELKKEASDS